MARKRISGPVRTGAKLLLPVGALILMSQFPAYAPSAERSAPAPAPETELPPLSAGPVAPPRPAPAAVPPHFEVKSVLALERGLQHGEYAWSAEGVPPGRIWVHVDIAAQTLRVYRGSSEIGRAVILYGADNKPTPTGRFRILEKDADHVSNLYDAPMPYMLRLTNDGIAIHGSHVDYGSATNGCVGVPEEFAALLFAEARVGDTVLVTGQKSPAQAAPLS
jgi:lipoprotein-anchoring transpeptidase ErfK/SrfK